MAAAVLVMGIIRLLAVMAAALPARQVVAIILMHTILVAAAEHKQPVAQEGYIHMVRDLTTPAVMAH